MSSMSSRQFDPLALSRGRFLPVESSMPGTTLEVIPMEASLAGLGRCLCCLLARAVGMRRCPPGPHHTVWRHVSFAKRRGRGHVL